MTLRIFAFSIALAALPSVALAQPYYRDARGPQYESQYEVQSYAARLGGRQCTAWCPQDYSPCDPTNFKIADGRCRPAGAQGFSR
jgi:hypothetical protein